MSLRKRNDSHHPAVRTAVDRWTRRARGPVADHLAPRMGDAYVVPGVEPCLDRNSSDCLAVSERQLKPIVESDSRCCGTVIGALCANRDDLPGVEWLERIYADV